MRGQCDHDKWLLCILLGYSLLGLYLVGAMLVCSLKVIYFSMPSQEYEDLVSITSITSDVQESAKPQNDVSQQA